MEGRFMAATEDTVCMDHITEAISTVAAIMVAFPEGGTLVFTDAEILGEDIPDFMAECTLGSTVGCILVIMVGWTLDIMVGWTTNTTGT